MDGTDKEDSKPDDEEGLEEEILTCACLAVLVLQQQLSAGCKRRRPRGRVEKQIRRSVESVMRELGVLTRRYFRMSKQNFWALHSQLEPELQHTSGQTDRNLPNGTITTVVRLAAALRYFAGGSALDIALVFGISHADAFNSVWIVVDAIHNTKDLDIKYPESHSKQHKIAHGFQKRSSAQFYGCAGAIDGMLVWTHKWNACMDAQTKRE